MPQENHIECKSVNKEVKDRTEFFLRNLFEQYHISEYINRDYIQVKEMQSSFFIMLERVFRDKVSKFIKKKEYYNLTVFLENLSIYRAVSSFYIYGKVIYLQVTAEECIILMHGILHHRNYIALRNEFSKIINDESMSMLDSKLQRDQVSEILLSAAITHIRYLSFISKFINEYGLNNQDVEEAQAAVENIKKFYKQELEFLPSKTTENFCIELFGYEVYIFLEVSHYEYIISLINKNIIDSERFNELLQELSYSNNNTYILIELANISEDQYNFYEYQIGLLSGFDKKSNQPINEIISQLEALKSQYSFYIVYYNQQVADITCNHQQGSQVIETNKYAAKEERGRLEADNCNQRYIF